MFDSSEDVTMSDIGELLTGLGLKYDVDDDGDITFTMRLPGHATREADGSPDWSPLLYGIQTDLTIAGEFTGLDDYTDLAKRIVRFYFVGARLASGLLETQVYPKVVPAKFEHAAHIAVVPTRAEAEAFNTLHTVGYRAKHWSDHNFGLYAVTNRRPTEDWLRDLISVGADSAASFMAGRFSGVMNGEPA